MFRLILYCELHEEFVLNLFQLGIFVLHILLKTLNVLFHQLKNALNINYNQEEKSSFLLFFWKNFQLQKGKDNHIYNLHYSKINNLQLANHLNDKLFLYIYQDCFCNLHHSNGSISGICFQQFHSQYFENYLYNLQGFQSLWYLLEYINMQS